MGKYIAKRLVRGLVSVVIVVVIVMLLVYGLMNREQIFYSDEVYSKMHNNTKTTYTYQRYEDYGYLDYVPYADYLTSLMTDGEITSELRDTAVLLGNAEDGSQDSPETAEYVAKFTEYYQSQGYTVERLKVIRNGKRVADGGGPQLFAYKDIPLWRRAISYFASLFQIDNIHKVEGDVGERGLTFTLHDPVYGGEKFSPAIIGNGTFHKYLLYFDGEFPYLHQNFLTIHLGLSYSVNRGVDVFDTMTRSQGSLTMSEMTYPTGLTEVAADDLHTATYLAGSRESSDLNMQRFTDDYTNVSTHRNSHSKMGFSFILGIISTILSYIIGLPLGIAMSRNKDRLFDKVGTVFIIFIIAVPSLAYIFLFKAIGGSMGLPTAFLVDSKNVLQYVLPIISLALPSIANLMKWMRRYMIDQMNSDYVKFARAEGLSEREIFYKHIMKNAAIPITHGIPGSLLFAMTGSIITERVYVVPGAGNLLTSAINAFDNGVIVGVTMFYALLSVVSAVLGDVLMAVVDPRISFTNKAR